MSYNSYSQYNVEEYVKSYYYSAKGEKVEGYILFKPAKISQLLAYKPCYIKFKKEEDTKPIELTTLEVSSFKINKDSFAIISNVNIKFECGMNTVSEIITKDFAKVELIGRINAFIHYSTVNLGMTYGMGFNNEVVLSKDKRNYRSFDLKRQKEEFADYIGDNKELKDYILITKPRKIDILDVIQKYNNVSH